jgi:photosystem II stability/assembly factor-like uncharacterized protein
MLKHISSRFSPLLLIVFLLASCGSPSAANRSHLLPRRNIHPTFLNSKHMFDRRQGWALGNDPNTSLISSILRTSDGGQSWQDVTPPGYTLHGPIADFVSPLVAWIVMPQADNTTTQIIRTSDSGTTWQGYIIRANSISRVNFLDSQHGWLLTSTDNDQHFDIWRTTDGSNWRDIVTITSSQSASSQLEITGLTFLNVSTGWLTGGTVTNVPWFYITHDGGQSWQYQSIPLPAHIQSVHPDLLAPTFLNAHIGFVTVIGFFRNCAQNTDIDSVYRTGDGGTSWQPTGLTPLIASPSFINPSQGWALSSSGVSVSRDGGQNWTHIPSDSTLKSALNIDTIQFVSETVGWASGRDQQKFPLLLKTIDGGRSWLVVHPQMFTSVTPKLALDATPASAPAPATPVALEVPKQTGLPPVQLPDAPAVVNIHMFDAQHGWGETPRGKYELPHLLHTSDGGRTWQDVLPQDQQGSRQNTLADDFLDTSTAWFALNGYHASAVILSIYRTSGGGQSWREAHITLNIPNSTLEVRQLSFSDANHGWLLLTGSQDQTEAEAAVIYATSDGGQNWTQASTTGTTAGSIPLKGDKASMAFLNAQVGWLTVGPYVSDGFYKTSDGGHTWGKQSLPAFSNPTKPIALPLAPAFFDANNGILAVQYYNGTSSEGIVFYATRNAGVSWQVVSVLPITITGALSPATIDFLDTDYGWIIDGSYSTLYRTSDGGRHWSKHASFNGLQAVSFASSQLGWAEDSNSCSLLLTTADGGQTWNSYHYMIVS